MIRSVLCAVLAGAGLYLILCDLLRIPYRKTIQTLHAVSPAQKNAGLERWLDGLAQTLSRHIPMNEWKRAQLESDLKTAEISVSPELFCARAIVKASIIGFFAIPMLAIFPLLSPVLLIAAFVIYRNEKGKISVAIRKKRTAIEYELSRLAFNIEKTLYHSRDVLYMLESYIPHAGTELQHELAVTCADMRSGNYESAIMRLDERVGSPMLSDVCRGLISILQGDNTIIFWSALGNKFSNYQREQLRLQARKVPHRVKRLSVCILVCFMLVYVVVILSQIMQNIGVIFA